MWRDFAGRAWRRLDRGLLSSDVGLLRHERNHDVSTPQTDTSVYRDHLLPLIHGWRARAARVAVFGTGPHTTALLDAVPELEALPLSAYIESDPNGIAVYRDRPVLPLAGIEDAVDVVVCSSYTREAEQLRLLDGYAVKAYPSRAPRVGVGPTSDYLVVPTFGYPVVLDTEPDARFEAVDAVFEQQIDRFRAELDRLRPYFAELNDIPTHQIDDVTPFWENGYFSGDDARVAYAAVRAHRPRRIIEIGGGHSTKFMRRAIARNGGGTRITSIDPFPRQTIDALCDDVIRKPLQHVDPETFDLLEPGDVLFMDGTHQVFRGTDSVSFYLRVLPRVKPGVRVHIHDITLPRDYPDEFGERYYAEQYLVATLLLGGDVWHPTLPVAYLYDRGLLTHGGNSFWISRASDERG